MLYKEEEDEVSLLFVNDCFYDKRNAVVGLYRQALFKAQD
jgi:hypothetical protein